MKVTNVLLAAVVVLLGGILFQARVEPQSWMQLDAQLQQLLRSHQSLLDAESRLEEELRGLRAELAKLGERLLESGLEGELRGLRTEIGELRERVLKK